MTLIAPQSLAAAERLPAALLDCSAGLAWTTTLVRRFADPDETDGFETAATPDALICANVGGHFDIESRRGRRWAMSPYRHGTIGLTAPHRRSTLRWRGGDGTPKASLHVFLAAPMLDEVAGQLGRPQLVDSFPDVLALDDPVVRRCMEALAAALATEAEPLLADGLGYDLAARLLSTTPGPRGGMATRGGLSHATIHELTDHMHAHLREPIGLEALAALVPMSKFHFLRSFEAATGLTPYRYLRLMRLREAALLLRHGDLSVARVTAAVGYANSAKLAAAFRQHYGMSPSAYRAAHRPAGKP